MTRTLLVSITALGLIGGANLAMAQGGTPAAAPGPGGAKTSTTAKPAQPTTAPTALDRATPSGPSATAPATDATVIPKAEERTAK